MNFLIKIIFSLSICALSTKIIAAPISIEFIRSGFSASLIDRPDFGINSVEYDFETDNFGDTNVGDGTFLASGGSVSEVSASRPDFTPPNGYSTSSSFSGTPDFTFNAPVSSFGFDFSFEVNKIFDIFINDPNSLTIAQIRLNGSELPTCTPTSFLACGFVGINIENNPISTVVIGINGSSNFSLEADNIIYQQAAVPTPGILWLVGSGFLGFFWIQKRNFS